MLAISSAFVAPVHLQAILLESQFLCKTLPRMHEEAGAEQEGLSMKHALGTSAVTHVVGGQANNLV